MSAGRAIGCFGLTEPDFGSHASGMRTRAERRGSSWVLNGTKRWITNGSIADVAIVWARTDDGIRGFLVEKGTPGFESRDIKGKFSLRASVTSELFLQDLEIPEENRLPKAAEAGVWVIAETDDRGTGFVKIVVSDEDGRFVLPQLPEATYDVWVRGYGLADSEPVAAAPGDDLVLAAAYPKTPQEEARVYPASYWYSLMEVPHASEFPGTGASHDDIEFAQKMNF